MRRGWRASSPSSSSLARRSSLPLTADPSPDGRGHPFRARRSARAIALIGLALSLASLTAGCASAMRKNVPFEELLARSGGDVADEPAADRLVARAESAFAEATIDGVRRSIRFWMSAYARDASSGVPLAEAAKNWGWLADRLEVKAEREAAALSAVQTAQLCDKTHREEIRCRYSLALAYGVQANERRRTGLDALPRIVELLTEVIDEAPELDFAGPHRVLALVHLRAPRWPLGPGDADLALEHAEQAVDLFPDHAPNQLALGEAYVEIDEIEDARKVYEKALTLAQDAEANGEAAARRWREDAEAALADLPE